MKRFVFSVFCFSLIAFRANALTQDYYLNLGPSFQNLTNVSEDAVQSPWENHGMLGINLNFYGFWNGGNIGLFFAANSLTFPLYNPDINTGRLSDGSQLILGPGFRRSIAPKLTILGGLGPIFYYRKINAGQRDIKTYNLGAAGQAAIKLDLTNLLCTIFGVKAGYAFAYYSDDSSSKSGWLNQNIMVNPFIGIGFNLNFGKPDNAGKAENQ